MGAYLMLLVFLILYWIRAERRFKERELRIMAKEEKELAKIIDPDYLKVTEWVLDIGFNKYGIAVRKRYERLGITIYPEMRKQLLDRIELENY